jgi:hypothetical protein
VIAVCTFVFRPTNIAGLSEALMMDLLTQNTLRGPEESLVPLSILEPKSVTCVSWDETISNSMLHSHQDIADVLLARTSC